MVALDITGKAFTDGRARYIHLLTRLKNGFNRHNCARCELTGFGWIKTELFKHATRLDASFRKVTC